MAFDEKDEVWPKARPKSTDRSTLDFGVTIKIYVRPQTGESLMQAYRREYDHGR